MTSTQNTFVLSFWNQRTRSITRDLLLSLAGSWFIALLAQVSIPLPFTPVPVTGQSLGVLVVGAGLGSTFGLVSVLFYLLQGIAGLPFFADGASGVAYLVGPTGGYLMGFAVAAFLSGKSAEKRLDRKVTSAIPAFIWAQFAIYSIGLPWLGYTTGFQNLLAKGFWPFVPGLIVKSTLAGLILPALWKIRK